MRIAVIVSIAVALSAGVSIGLMGATPAESASTKTVRIGDNWFVERSGVPTVNVRRGDRVRWRWTGRSPHNVTVVSGPTRFRSSTKTSGTFTRELRRRGTYRIICTVHGADDQSMRLRVR